MKFHLRAKSSSKIAVIMSVRQSAKNSTTNVVILKEHVVQVEGALIMMNSKQYKNYFKAKSVISHKISY